MSISHPGFINPDPRGFLPWHPDTNRIADALERIAAALERPYPKFNPGGYVKLSWLADGIAPAVDRNARADAEGKAGPSGDDGHRIGATLPDPNRCEPGCIRPSLHGGDCDVRVVADPLDESDHRPRHFPDGEHLYRNSCGRWHHWTSRRCYIPHDDTHTLAWWDEPLTFCDCPDPVVTEAENRAGD